MKVHSPRLPFSSPIPGRLVPGSKITIVGWPLEKCKTFSVNLKLGPVDEEIALNLSVRFKPGYKENVVIRNSLTSAGWGTEEKETPFFPFLTKNAYKIEILCEKARFRISVDDRQLATFTHRLPLAYISHVEIHGDTELTFLEIPSVEFVGTPRNDFEGSGGMNNLSLKDDNY